MPMDRERHEEILNSLLNPELEQSQRTELLQELRADYNGVITEHDEMTQNIDKLQKDNSDLVLSNSKLFRSQKITDNDGDDGEEKQKEFSETVTIEQLEKGGIK